jgi:hypothetical protein
LLENQFYGRAGQFSIDKFANITFDGNKQIIGEKKPLSVPQLVCVFVVAAGKYGEDQFFVLERSKVQDILIENHKKWLNEHGGIRPRKPDSMHCAFDKKKIYRKYKDNLVNN